MSKTVSFPPNYKKLSVLILELYKWSFKFTVNEFINTFNNSFQNWGEGYYQIHFIIISTYTEAKANDAIHPDADT